MYFPVADIHLSLWIPPTVAFVISFFTSMAGISGAFLILPFQMSVLGFDSPAVSSTNQLYNIVAIPSGVYRYIKEGRMVWPLTWIIILGTLPGVLVGAVIRIQYLPDPRHFKMFAGFVLLYIGEKLLKDLLLKNKNTKPSAELEFQKLVKSQQASKVSPTQLGQKKKTIVSVKKFNFSRITYEFSGQLFDVSVAGIMTLSLIVGIIGGVYGIGGGSIIAPFLVGFFGLPIYTIAGAALMATFVTSVAGVIFYQAMAPFYPDIVMAPDWILGLLFGIGGFIGMYCGARVQKFVPAKVIKWLMVFCILFASGRYLLLFF